MDLKNSQTFINLAKTYAGECQARTRYEFMEYGARMQGLKNLADIIDEIAFNEFNHSRMFYSFIQSADDQCITNIHIDCGFPFKEKWNLLENLKFAADDENSEAVRIYPEFMRIAEEEGFRDIAALYRNVIEVEKQHKAIFTELYNQMKNGTLYKKSKPVVWKCGDCGYGEISREAFNTCPLCHAKQGAVYLHVKAHTEPDIAAIKQSSKNLTAQKKPTPKPQQSAAKNTAAKPASAAKPTLSSASPKSTAVKPASKTAPKPSLSPAAKTAATQKAGAAGRSAPRGRA